MVVEVDPPELHFFQKEIERMDSVKRGSEKGKVRALTIEVFVEAVGEVTGNEVNARSSRVREGGILTITFLEVERPVQIEHPILSILPGKDMV